MRNEIHQVELSFDDIKEALSYDCVAFLAFYLEDKLTHDVPELHEEIWAELVHIIKKVNANNWTDSLGEAVDHLQKLFCVPRGHSKSTLIKLAVVLFLRYSVLSFALYVSLTTTIARNACLDIFGWFNSDKDQTVYGTIKDAGGVNKANATDGVWDFWIHTPHFGRKRVILKCLGADQQVRGLLIDGNRPQLIVIDDVEDNSTAATPETQQKMDIWLMGNMLKATARHSVRIWLGNMISERTMLFRISKDPEWNPTIYGAIVRDRVTGQLKPLWQGMFTLKGLLKEYHDYRSKGLGFVWIYEMMNMTAESVFKTEMGLAARMTRPLPDEVTQGFIVLDPAFGLKAWHDSSGITVHVRHRNSDIPWVVESTRMKGTEDQLLDELIRLSFYWNLTTWVIESVAAQRLLIPLFKALLKARMMPPELFMMIPVISGTAKANRIFAMVKSVSAVSYGIVEEEAELFDLLHKYDPDSEEPDDLIDSASFGVIAWAQAGTMIKDAINVKEAMALMQTDDSGWSGTNEVDLCP